MPNPNELVTPARKLLPIIYVLDSSGSMAGDRISAVNEAMHETIEVLKEVSENNPTAELKIGVLRFASDAEWVTSNGLVFLEDYYWNDIEAGGLTDFGSALDKLCDKLSRSGFLNSDVGYKVPVIIFMSDGEPTDDWESALSRANDTNKWFRVATKIGIAVGDGADRDVLARIVGRNGKPSMEAVIPVNNIETLKKLIKVVSVTASMVGSKSRTSDDSQAEVINEIHKEMDLPGTVVATNNSSAADSGSDDDVWGSNSPDDDPWGGSDWV